MADRPPRDDYLYDGEGAPDPQVQRLERALSSYRLGEFEPRERRQHPRWGWLAAAAVVLAVGATAVGLAGRRGVDAACSDRAWAMSEAGARSCLDVGEWLETDAAVALEVADLGHVSVQPDSRLRVVESSAESRRLELARGRINAVISAPPRLFLVDTPAGTAVDLGCAYELVVERDGATRLEVSAGEVAIAHGKEEIVVPAGVTVQSWPDGVGIPYRSDADGPFVDALVAWSRDPSAEPKAVLANATGGDAPSLLHVLRRADPSARGAVLTAIEAHVPLPPGVSRARAEALDAHALSAWRATMVW